MTIDPLHPRILQFAPGAALKASYIDPGKYVASRLVADLADSWMAGAEADALTPATAARQSVVIRRLGEFLTEDADRFLTLNGHGAEVVRRLHDWESAAVNQFPPPSVHAKKLGTALRLHVARHLRTYDLEGGVLDDWAKSSVLDGRPYECLPLDEFNNSERLELERTCREIVRATEDRLRRGAELLEVGRDPRSGGWDQVENVLWALRYLPYDPSFRQHLAGDQRQLDSRAVDLMSGVIRRRVNAPPIPAAVGAFLVPSDEYLLAIRILLHLQTGWAPEESAQLRRADIEFSGDAVRVRARKLRAQRVRWHTLDSPHQPPWGWKAGDLLRRASFAMKHAHAMTPAETTFWVVPVQNSRNRLPNEYPSFQLRPEYFMQDCSLRTLVEKYTLSISRPYDMRRLRKTVKSARAVLIGSLNGAAGDDHSIEVFRNHYAQTTTVHTIAAQTVLRAQQKVLDRARKGPTFVDVAAKALAVNGVDPELAVIANAVAAESPLEQQLSITACRDPYQGPAGQPGTLCHASPSMCLQCRNAVIFRDHLPRLVAYRTTLADIEKTMTPIAFTDIYGEQMVNLDAVLARFSDDEIDRARAQRLHVHRPFGQRAEQ